MSDSPLVPTDLVEFLDDEAIANGHDVVISSCPVCKKPGTAVEHWEHIQFYALAKAFEREKARLGIE